MSTPTFDLYICRSFPDAWYRGAGSAIEKPHRSVYVACVFKASKEKAVRRRVRALADAEAQLLQIELAGDGSEWEPLDLYQVIGDRRIPFVEGRELATEIVIQRGADIEAPPVAGLVAMSIFTTTLDKFGPYRDGDMVLVVHDATYMVRVFTSYLRIERKRPDLAEGVDLRMRRMVDEMKEPDDDS